MDNFSIQLLTEIQENISAGNAAYEEVLSCIFKKLGITNFSYVYVGYTPSEADEIIILGNYPPDWVKSYKSSALFRHDPIINYSSKTSEAFFWEEAVNYSAISENIFEKSSQYGIEQGFSIPMHEPGCAFGSMHFATSKDNKEFPEIIKNHSFVITTVSYIAHRHRPALARREPYPSLTKREVECLHWAAMGKSYGEISLILGISERTVKFHAKNIVEKLDAVNIRQAMMKALRMNYI